MKKLLPQANNLETVINVLIYYGNKENCTISDIASFCGFEPRQAQYYLGANIYLDFIDEELKLTTAGKNILKEPLEIKLKFYHRIITDDIIGKIFAYMLLYRTDGKDYSINLLKKLYPEYSYAVIERRASTLRNWCNEIIRYIN